MSQISPVPLLSVIIPTCERNEDLTLCLDAFLPEPSGENEISLLRSIQNHSLPRGSVSSYAYEIIVTDDGKRSTAEKLVRDKYPFVRWLAGPRRGPAANRNWGARKAHGDWILFLDDDCVPSPAWLDAYAIGTRQFPDDNVFEGSTIAPTPKTRSDHESPINVTGGLLWSCNFGIKRRLFLDIGGFDEKFPVPAMEDMDLQFRLEQIGHKSRFLPDARAQHPWRPRRGTRFCLDLAKSVQYFTEKHPEARLTYLDTWGFKRMIKIALFEFPRNLFQFHDITAFRVLYLDLLTAIRITSILHGHRHSEQI